MRSDAAAPEHSGGPRLLKAMVSGLGALAAAALFSGLFDGGLPPKPAWAGAAAAAAAAGGDGPAWPSSTPRLCLHGAGGEILDFAPRGRCP